MQEGGSGQCSSGSPTVSTQKEEKEEKKKKGILFTVLPPAGKMEKPLKG